MVLKPPEIPKDEVAEVDWPTFLEGLHSGWGQGEHVSAFGRTRGGKTTTLVQWLDDRRYVFALLTKRRDDLYPLLKKRGYKIVTDLKDRPSIDSAPKIALHVSPEGLSRKEAAKQADTLRDALHQVWNEGGWTLYADEIAGMTDVPVGMATEFRSMYKEAASSKVTLVAGTQRPSRVPLEMYSQARFIAFWRSSDREELRRMAGMNGVDPEIVRAVVAQLDRYEILVVDCWSGELVRTRPPKLT